MQPLTVKDRRFLAAVNRAPAAERRQIVEALRRMARERMTQDTAAQILVDLVLATDRTRRRAASDSRTDPERRILVGARIPRDTAEIYRAQAAAQGVSLYRWVSDALAAYAARPLVKGGGEHGTDPDT